MMVDGAIYHAKSCHSDSYSDFHICDTRKCLAVVTVKVKGSKHRHDFGQAELSCTGVSVDQAECSCSGDVAEFPQSGDIAESSAADVAECSRPGKWGKQGK